VLFEQAAVECEVLAFKAGDVLTEVGGDPASMLVIGRGRARFENIAVALATRKDGQAEPQKDLQTGDTFGEQLVLMVRSSEQCSNSAVRS
jgi:hypothetical protein